VRSDHERITVRERFSIRAASLWRLNKSTSRHKERSTPETESEELEVLMIRRFILVSSPLIVMLGCSQPAQESSSQSAQALATAAPDAGAKPPHDHGPPPGHGHPHGPPPPEAFAACDGKTADASCTVALPDRTLDGTCRTPPPDSGETRLACAPAHPPRPRP
jgi:hypothetical protein